MRATILFLLFMVFTLTLHAQFYYKDDVLPRQTAEQMQRYRSNKIRSVHASSVETGRDNPEGVQVTQMINGNYTEVITNSKSPLTGESVLTSTHNEAGFVLKTVDTTDGSGSTTTYQYDSANKITSVTNMTSSPGHITEKEEHLWKYNAFGAPVNMWKIRNDRDTTYVTFVLDEKGNVTEERSRRNGRDLAPVYYYYDNQNRLTDIVHYNPIAKRLLPDYVFEYDASGRLRSMLVVPSGNTDYQRWIYAFDERGLKAKETVYNKNRQALGTVEYRYE